VNSVRLYRRLLTATTDLKYHRPLQRLKKIRHSERQYQDADRPKMTS
jgi:hypothetical protein